MQRIQDIDLREVFQKYLDTSEILHDGDNRYKCLCPFHEDTNPSLVLYDNTKDGKGWAYHCFVCNAHGSAPTALVESHYASSEDDAIKILRDDFNLKLPDKVTLKDFCQLKGLDPKFCKAQGLMDGEKGLRIPILNIEGNPENVKVRTKYVGTPKYHFEVEGKEQLPYGLNLLPTYSKDVLYLTEGETDCLTLLQAGFPALGIGGANAFKPKYINYIKDFNRIVIVRDTDAAGQKLVESITKVMPNVYTVMLPSTIKDINDYHVYRCMGDIKVFQERFPALPVVPATPTAFIEAVVEGDLSPTDKHAWNMVARAYPTQADRLMFKDTFSKATKVSKAVINQCLKSITEVSDTAKDPGFEIRDNSYVKKVSRDGVTVTMPISNFILKPKSDLVSEDGVTRVVDLISSSGKHARNVYFEPEELANTTKFNQKCLASGDYIFTGSQEDLYTICYTIFKTPKKVVHSPKLIGRLPSGEWLLGNCGIDRTGTIVKPDDDGVITLSGTDYKPRSVTIDDDTGDMPMPNLALLSYPYPEDYLLNLARSFRECFGTYGAWLGLGWVIAGWFSHDIFNQFGCYPYLFVTGKRASGKSVFCTLLQQSYGFNPATCGMSIESPTPVGMLRYLSYRSSLPQWFDDYRNSSKRIQAKESLLLDIYNRHGSVKGTKTGGVSQETVNGYVLLSGEDTPSNNAVTTRCCLVTLSQHHRNPRLIGGLTEQFRLLPTYALRWAKAAVTEPQGLLKTITDLQPTISPDLRDSLNRSIFAGAFLWALGSRLTDTETAEFLDYVRQASIEQVAESEEYHPLAQFLNEFPDYSRAAGLTHNVDYLISDGRLFFRFTSFYKAWCDYHRSPPLTQGTLLGYLKREPAYVGESRKRFDTVGQQRCYSLDIETLADDYKDLYEYLTELSGRIPM